MWYFSSNKMLYGTGYFSVNKVPYRMWYFCSIWYRVFQRQQGAIWDVIRYGTGYFSDNKVPYGMWYFSAYRMPYGTGYFIANTMSYGMWPIDGAIPVSRVTGKQMKGTKPIRVFRCLAPNRKIVGWGEHCIFLTGLIPNTEEEPVPNLLLWILSWWGIFQKCWCHLVLKTEGEPVQKSLLWAPPWSGILGNSLCHMVPMPAAGDAKPHTVGTVLIGYFLGELVPLGANGRGKAGAKSLRASSW